MPKCPKCNRIYTSDKEICKDCDTELEKFDPPRLVSFKEVDKILQAQKFVKFLHYSNIASAAYEFNEENNTWNILVNESDLKETKKLYDAFYSVETENDSEYQANNNSAYGKINNPENNELEEDFNKSESNAEEESLFDQEELQDVYNGKKGKPEKPQTYVKKEEQYKDLISSAFSFIVISIIGILLLSINAMGIISLFNGALTYIVMGGMFLVFLYIGITTLIRANKVKGQISEENQVTDAINSWLSQNVTKEGLNELVNPKDTEEIQFMQKIERMKELIIKQFGELGDLYLDRIVEEYYNNHFEE